MHAEQWHNQPPAPLTSLERARDFTVHIRIAFPQAIATTLEDASHLSATMRQRLVERHEIGTLLAETTVSKHQALRLLEAIKLDSFVTELDAQYGSALFQPGDAPL